MPTERVGARDREREGQMPDKRVGAARASERRPPADDHAAQGHVVTFVEHGTHKTIGAVCGPMSGTIRVSDQATIDYLREAFEKAGWRVEDHAA